MNRIPSNLGPALSMALVMLAAAALAKAAPQAAWTAVAAPLLLVLALVGTDLVQRRRAGRRPLPSASVLLVAAAILVACGIVASRDLDGLAAMIPILGSCAAVPVILRRQGTRTSCRRAAGLPAASGG
jgi:peptidoglycan/LPS O-acetylase OafA/YrhL